VYSGETQINTPNSSFELAQNDVCLMNGGFIFSQYLPHDEDIVFTLFFDKDYLLRNVLKDTKINSTITKFILDFIMDSPNPQNYIIFHGKDNDRLQNIMANLLCEYIEPREYSIALIESYIRIFLLETFCCTFEYTKTQEGRQSLQIAQILDYIDKNFSFVTLDLLAEKFGYNSKYLSRLIKNYTGKNFKDLVAEKRMEHASLLLLNSGLTIHSIMEECGLCNESYFYHCFYDKYHMTPNEYRRGGYSVC
jgi:AraC-like DNA-binding protein